MIINNLQLVLGESSEDIWSRSRLKQCDEFRDHVRVGEKCNIKRPSVVVIWLLFFGVFGVDRLEIVEEFEFKFLDVWSCWCLPNFRFFGEGWLHQVVVDVAFHDNIGSFGCFIDFFIVKCRKQLLLKICVLNLLLAG